ncbi:MAG: ABC transporter ATP-binding protein [Clostridia bacterium]|nr:ABC transporter ATP-binding protein [Clostridia bacterium]MBQ6785322.1 ABC transporter ATP-binding protein [Clostridia bacterium]
MTDEEKAAAPKFTKELGLRILSYLRPYKLKFFIVIVVVLLSAALGVVPSLLTGKMVDDGLLAGNFRVLVELIIASFLVTVVSNALGLLETWLNTSIAQGIIYDMKTQMYTHFQKQPYQYFVESKQGEIVTRMTGDVNGVQSAVSTTMTNSIKNVGTIIVSIVALFQCNWILALTGMAIVPFFILPARVTGKRRWIIARESQEKYDEANSILGETLSESGILLVWLFGKQKREAERFKGVSSDLYSLNIREMLAGRSFFMFINIFTNFGPLLLYLVGGILMLRMEGGPQVTVGEITAAISILGRIYRPVNELMNVGVDFTRSLALFERIFSTLDMVPSIVDKEGATAPEVIRGEIEYDDVHFAYKEDGPEILQGVSFHVEPGETYALVGSSGAGKSTMISLVPRLYDVLGGAIRIDGKDVRDWPLQELRSHIGFVTQDTFLFNDTIRANLQYAKPEATDEELMDACRRAGIADFIEELKDGLDTVVGNRGVRLSGGEKQRLSLARVILKDPEVILLDEATASLDSVSESHIQEALAPLLKEKTSLVVAHRLSTILDSDRILVLKDGHIVASGKHADLLASSEDYRTFYDTQFKAVDEETQSRRRRALREQRTEAEASALAWRRSQGHWQELADFESYY